MNDKKKNVEMKPEDHKKVSQALESEEITDFDEMRKKEDIKKESNDGDSDTGKDIIKGSKSTDEERNTGENADETKSAKEEPVKQKKEKVKKEEKKESKKKSQQGDKTETKEETDQASVPVQKSDKKIKDNKNIRSETASPKPEEAKKEEDSSKKKGSSKKEELPKKKDPSKKEESLKKERKPEPAEKSKNSAEGDAVQKENTKSHEDDRAVSKKEVQSKEEVKKNTKGNSKEKEDTNKAISQSKKIADTKTEMAVSPKIAETENKQKTSQSQKEKTKNKKILWITLGVAAGILLIAYFTGFIYFSGHFYQSVAINGIDVSDMNQEGAKQTLDYFYKNYVLTLETIDGEEIPIQGKDISMQITLRDEFSSCFKQQKAYLWFVNMFKHYDFNIGADTAWDSSALSDIFKSMKILNKKSMTAPKDAYVGVEDGKFTIVKEVMGNTINVNQFKQTVENSLTNVVSEIVLKDENCYDLPKVYSTDDEIKKDLEAKNEFAQNEIKIQLDDITLEPGMELYDTVLEKEADGYEVSRKLVEKYVKSLAKKYDTLGKERNFTTSFQDREIKINGTAFGYELNQDETTQALYDALKAGKSTTVEAVFNEKGYTLKGENDIGDTYIEVNLSEQKVFAYKNGEKIAEGDCVSGNESAGHGTCTGLYAIQNKLSPTVLRGEKKPVTKTTTKKKKGKKVKVTTTTYEYEYESPVTFWMQFNGGIGLHDAAGWRSSYGGSIYYYNGSHGCVNLPYSLAETLYKNYDIGTPVIVYFWDNENRQ